MKPATAVSPCKRQVKQLKKCVGKMGTLLLTTFVSRPYKEMYPYSAGDPRSSPFLLAFNEFLLFSLQLTASHLERRARPKGLSGSAVINAVRWVHLAPSGGQVPSQGPHRQLAVCVWALSSKQTPTSCVVERAGIVSRCVRRCRFMSFK